MSTDVWNGAGYWHDGSKWSAGAPPASNQNAYLQSGADMVSGVGTAHSLQVDAGAVLTSVEYSQLTVSGYFANNSSLGTALHGQATISGNLFNADPAQLTLTAPTVSNRAVTSISAANLVNNGTLTIRGGYLQALVSIAGGAAGGFSGSTVLSGKALLKYAGAGASVVNSGASLEILGSDADVTFANVSLLTTLSANFGQLFLRGSAGGAGGVQASVAGGFVGVGMTGFDDLGGSGGSQISFGGVYLVASGLTTIGNSMLSAATHVHFGSLINEGRIAVSGSANGGPATTVTVDGAAPATLTGAFSIAGNAELSFGSGAITYIQYGSGLTLKGSAARITAHGVDALGQFATNFGDLNLEGDTAEGAGGVTTHVAGALRNYHSLEVDAETLSGGSAVTIGGAMTNYGSMSVGNDDLIANVSLDVGSLVNQSTIFLQGAANNSARATLSTHSAAFGGLVGDVELAGAATLQFNGGQIGSIRYGASLELRGSGAQVTNGAGSALLGLRTNYGSLDFEGDDLLYGQGGAQAEFSGAFTNAGALRVDADDALGESHIVFDGAIVNYGFSDAMAAAGVNSLAAAGGAFIGNAHLSSATLVQGATLLNEGNLDIRGAANANVEARLALSGAANPSLTGVVTIAGDAALQYGGGAISNVQYGSALHLFGSGARILSGANSAFGATSPVSNYGQISLDGGLIDLGAGGAHLDMGGALSNYDLIQLDSDLGGAASSMTVAGVLTNYGLVQVGGVNPGGVGISSTSLQVGALANKASLEIGNSTGTAEVVTLASATNSGSVDIGAAGALRLQNGAAYTQTAGITNVYGSLSAGSVTVLGGKVEFKNALSGANAIGAFRIGMAGDLAFDDAVESFRTIAFDSGVGTLELRAPAFAGTISGWTRQDIIDVRNLATGSYSGYAYSAGKLTINLTAGGAEQLKFVGNYTTGSFRPLDDGQGGTDIVSGALDVWSGSGGWDGGAGNWSSGKPTSSTSAIVSANASLDAAGVDNVASLTVLKNASLAATPGSTLTVHGNLDNHGSADFRSYQSTISGTLINNPSAYLTLNTASGGNVTVSAANLYNQGYLSLYGGSGAAPTLKATLSVAGAARALLTGSVALVGWTELQYGSGGIASIADDASLSVYGGHAQITSGSGSALANLSLNDGVINLEGNYFGYQNGVYTGFAGGVSLQVAGGFTNADSFDIDGYSNGGSQVSFGGTFANTGSLTIGNANHTSDTLVSVGSLKNEGVLQISGDVRLASPHGATLAVGSNASSVMTGSVSLSGDATLQYAGGVISSLQYGSSLTLSGANARIVASGGLASPLSGLRVNAGTLTLQGNSDLGAGGVALTTAGFCNYGALNIDSGSALGGSSMTINGAFVNTGDATIGNGSLAADTILAVASLYNEGALSLRGAASGSKHADVNVTGAAGGAISGQWTLQGNASVNYLGGGKFSALQYGASLELDGAGAAITAGGQSALRGLAVNAGQLTFLGDTSVGDGGVTLNTAVDLVNSGALSIDSEDSSGGSAITIGGTLVNSGQIYVGNATGSAATSMNMTALVNQGLLSIQGGDAGAVVTVNHSAAGALTGALSLSGNAALAYQSGGFTSVQAGSLLTLYGPGAKILSGASSALSTLKANYGAIDLESGGYFGGAMSLSLNQGFVNYGYMQLDNHGAGGGALSIAGILTNDGSLTLGNGGETANTDLSTNGVNNAGFIAVASGVGSAGKLKSSGNFVNRGDVEVDSGGVIDASGFTYSQYAGVTNVDAGGSLLATNVQALGGLLEFSGHVGAGGPGALVIGATGDLQFDADVDAGRSVTFSGSGGILGLGDPVGFHATVQGFGGADAIDLLGLSVSGFSYAGAGPAGTLTLQTSGGDAALTFAGAYSTGSFTTMSDGAGGTKLLLA